MLRTIPLRLCRRLLQVLQMLCEAGAGQKESSEPGPGEKVNPPVKKFLAGRLIR